MTAKKAATGTVVASLAALPTQGIATVAKKIARPVLGLLKKLQLRLVTRESQREDRAWVDANLSSMAQNVAIIAPFVSSVETATANRAELAEARKQVITDFICGEKMDESLREELVVGFMGAMTHGFRGCANTATVRFMADCAIEMAFAMRSGKTPTSVILPFTAEDGPRHGWFVAGRAPRFVVPFERLANFARQVHVMESRALREEAKGIDHEDILRFLEGELEEATFPLKDDGGIVAVKKTGSCIVAVEGRGRCGDIVSRIIDAQVMLPFETVKKNRFELPGRLGRTDYILTRSLYDLVKDGEQHAKAKLALASDPQLKKVATVIPTATDAEAPTTTVTPAVADVPTEESQPPTPITDTSTTDPGDVTVH
jgi:hypothetical protein